MRLTRRECAGQVALMPSLYAVTVGFETSFEAVVCESVRGVSRDVCGLGFVGLGGGDVTQVSLSPLSCHMICERSDVAKIAKSRALR